MGNVPISPDARAAVTTALGSKLHWIEDADRAVELADAATSAFMGAEEIQPEYELRAGEDGEPERWVRNAGPWRRDETSVEDEGDEANTA